MSYRIQRHAPWRDDFRKTLEDDKNAEISRLHIAEVKQLCRAAVERGDLALLDQIQSSEPSLVQYVDACRREITG